MTNTDILLEDLEDVLDDATSIPLSKKYAVDVDKIKTIIEDIRLNTPQETKQAKAIVDSRNNILEEAKKEAPLEIEDSSNTAEKVVIIILIVLVVLGLLYLIFKKDDVEEVDSKKVKQDNSSNKNINMSKK